MAEEGSRPIYSIGVVARLLGTTPATIRTWEGRYGVVSPRRSPGGRRLYSPDEVDRLRFVKTQIDEGIQPADAHRLLAARIEGGSDRRNEGTEEGQRPLVLLAERDPHAADLSEHFLRSAGYEVDIALDPADAERKFAELSPQLVVVELLLSGGSGGDLCRRLKKRRASVPILAVSSLEAREAAAAAGAEAFLQKPLDPLELVSVVTGLLGSGASLTSDVGAPA
jgi:DNA-binding transcriptional MerR regulator